MWKYFGNEDPDTLNDLSYAEFLEQAKRRENSVSYP